MPETGESSQEMKRALWNEWKGWRRDTNYLFCVCQLDRRAELLCVKNLMTYIYSISIIYPLASWELHIKAYFNLTSFSTRNFFLLIVSKYSVCDNVLFFAKICNFCHHRLTTMTLFMQTVDRCIKNMMEDEFLDRTFRVVTFLKWGTVYSICVLIGFITFCLFFKDFLT